MVCTDLLFLFTASASTELADAYFPDTIIASSPEKVKDQFYEIHILSLNFTCCIYKIIKQNNEVNGPYSMFKISLVCRNNCQ